MSSKLVDIPLPRTGMLFLPDIETRVEWYEFTWEARQNYEDEKMDLEMSFHETMEGLYREFWNERTEGD